jgi:hypothetical protein
MKLIIVAFMTLLVNIVAGQESKQLQLVLGRSLNGTGDIRGYGFSVEYSKIFKKKFDWTATIGTNFHDGSFPIFFEYPIGNPIDGSVRYTTAGIQTAYLIGYNFLKPTTSSLKLKIGGLLRYQSTSYYDDVTVIYPVLTGLPYPVIVFRNSNPQKTMSAGLITNISYSYKINKKINIGIVGSYQFDTNGDNISQVSISIGRYL